ncbi:hypothetical protein EYF80_048257 [Liparis tanakae]|uniref:Uncharacterized protein n=1 Tax=Liparis tanakae TaxID=230148 RepID=A0A4Z2FK78_9TELE|nr:hypothetical protein EYF80_048257 [Liparis tanakae]
MTSSAGRLVMSSLSTHGSEDSSSSDSIVLLSIIIRRQDVIRRPVNAKKPGGEGTKAPLLTWTERFTWGGSDVGQRGLSVERTDRRPEKMCEIKGSYVVGEIM